MQLSVRNTFLHFSHDGIRGDGVGHVRSSSEPPTARKGKCGSENNDSESSTTASRTIKTSASSWGEIDESASQAANDPCGGDSPHSQVSLDKSDNPEQDELVDAQMSLAETRRKIDELAQSNGQLTLEETRQQIDALTQTALGIWSKLRSAEAKTGMTGLDAASPVAPPSESPTDASMSPGCVWVPASPVHMPMQWNVMGPVPVPAVPGGPRTPLKSTLAKGQSPCFMPRCPEISDADQMLASVDNLLKFVPGITNVKIEAGSEGTLTTIAIKCDSSVAKPCDVVTKAKSVLLEAAANSQTVYVMGYEVYPFKDKSESECAAMLAFMPVDWQQTACWDVYQKGKCCRGKTCKWRHPGKQQLQPIRIKVS